jgi:hypothetical protein
MRNSPGQSRPEARLVEKKPDTRCNSPNAVSIYGRIKEEAKDSWRSDCAWHQPAEKARHDNNIHLSPSRSFAFEMALDKPVFNLYPVAGIEQDKETGI